MAGTRDLLIMELRLLLDAAENNWDRLELLNPRAIEAAKHIRTLGFIHPPLVFEIKETTLTEVDKFSWGNREWEFNGDDAELTNINVIINGPPIGQTTLAESGEHAVVADILRKHKKGSELSIEIRRLEKIPPKRLAEHIAKILRRWLFVAESFPDEPRPADAPTPTTDAQSMFRLEDKAYTIRFEGKEIGLKPTKGLDYIGELISQPGIELKVYELDKMTSANPERSESDLVSEGLTVTSGKGSKLVSDKDVETVNEQIAELNARKNLAEQTGQLEKVEDHESQIAALTRWLRTNTDFRGKPRGERSEEEKRADAINAAIRRALTQIAQRHPSLHLHFQKYLRRGVTFMYSPTPAVPWLT